MTEAYTSGGSVANRLSTVTNGYLLSTSGEVYLNASMNGQELFGE